MPIKSSVVGVDGVAVEGRLVVLFRGRLGSRCGSGFVLWRVGPVPSWIAWRFLRDRRAVQFLGRATTPAFGVGVLRVVRGGFVLVVSAGS